MSAVITDKSHLTGVQRRRKQRAALLLFATVPLLLLLRPIHLESDPIQHLFDGLGGLTIVLAIMLRLWCTLHIGGRKCEELVRTGPYSLVRHPLYLASGLAVIGIGLQFGSLTAAAILLAGYVLVFSPVVRDEERFLAERFGSRFARYVESVPRFLPRRWRPREPKQMLCRPALLTRTLRDGLAFLLVLPAIELTEELHERALLPVLAQVY